MFCIKISATSDVARVHQFSSNNARKQWLLDAGFVNGLGVWHHPVSKKTAGVFESMADKGFTDAAFYNTCDQPIKLQRGIYDCFGKD